jgi:hypothetical protein
MLVSALLFLPAAGGHLEGVSHRSKALRFTLQTLRLHEFHYWGLSRAIPRPV